MFGRLLLLFVFLPMIELYLLIILGSRIGPMPTIGLIVLTGIIGATLARQQGLSTLAKIQNELKQGRAPTQELVEGAMILVGGLVLLTPGILTDIFGFAMMVPSIRKSLAKQFNVRIPKGFTSTNAGFQAGSKSRQDDDVIDV
ncbi:MAG: membrane protein FxsA [Opitutae bacterium]|nr:membrane protein FxsA [Opitutae bacterium]HAD21492.1 membrane protein FxsA [Opitutae bacterium]